MATSDWKFWQRVDELQGELLFSVCTELDLVITNTNFHVPKKRHYTWQHPDRSNHTFELRHHSKWDVKDMSASGMRGPEWSTDHSVWFSNPGGEETQNQYYDEWKNLQGVREQDLCSTSQQDKKTEQCKKKKMKSIQKHILQHSQTDWFDGNDVEIFKLET